MLTEVQEQNRLAKWLDMAVGPYGWAHPVNEGKRKRGAQAKQAGMKAGLPDALIFARPRGQPTPARVVRGHVQAHAFRGVAVELKRADGGTGLSPEQALWFRALQFNGWHVILAAGAEQAVEKLQALGFGVGIPLQLAAEWRG